MQKKNHICELTLSKLESTYEQILKIKIIYNPTMQSLTA